MALITLIHGASFFGDIVDYDWKGKFLVICVGKEGDVPHKRIIHWNNVEGVSGGDEKDGNETR